MDRVVGFNGQIITDLIFQGVNTVLIVVVFVVLIRLGLLGIKALKIYIKKNS